MTILQERQNIMYFSYLRKKTNLILSFMYRCC